MLDIKKDMIRYGFFTILCIIINIVYSKFSHNVSSVYMSYMFIIPIIGFIISIFNKTNLYKNLIACSTLTITLSSLLEGIVQIAGTDSKMVYVLLIIGIFLLIIAVLTRIKKSN